VRRRESREDEGLLGKQLVEGFLVLPEVPPLGDLAVGVEMEDVDDLLVDPLA
jgi:hypothetical protein